MEKLFCVLISLTNKAKDTLTFHTIAKDSSVAFNKAESFLKEKGIKTYMDMSCTIVSKADGRGIYYE